MSLEILNFYQEVSLRFSKVYSYGFIIIFFFYSLDFLNWFQKSLLTSAVWKILWKIKQLVLKCSISKFSTFFLFCFGFFLFFFFLVVALYLNYPRVNLLMSGPENWVHISRDRAEYWRLSHMSCSVNYSVKCIRFHMTQNKQMFSIKTKPKTFVCVYIYLLLLLLFSREWNRRPQETAPYPRSYKHTVI